MKKLLVIEAHSDDSALGGYGLIRRFNSLGYQAHFIMCACSDVQFVHCGLVKKEQRLKEYADYVRHMNGALVEEFEPVDADGSLDVYPRARLVGALEKAIKAVRPNVLLCQAPSFHHDHTAVYEATMAAIRPTARIELDEVLLMENSTYVHSIGVQTDFRPTVFVKMTSEQMDEKIRCFKDCFPSQIRYRENVLSPEGIRAWARYRALECRYAQYAEAFVQYMRTL